MRIAIGLCPLALCTLVGVVLEYDGSNFTRHYLTLQLVSREHANAERAQKRRTRRRRHGHTLGSS